MCLGTGASCLALVEHLIVTSREGLLCLIKHLLGIAILHFAMLETDFYLRVTLVPAGIAPRNS